MNQIKLFGIMVACMAALSFISAQTSTNTGNTQPGGTTINPAGTTQPGGNIGGQTVPSTSPLPNTNPIRNSSPGVSPTPITSPTPIVPNAGASVSPIPSPTASPTASPSSR
jgi:hypothetical protein